MADEDRFELYEAEEQWEAEKESLEERVKSLEAEAEAASELRQRVKELEGQLEHAHHIQVTMRQSTAQWRQRVEVEHAERQKAEERAEEYRRKGSQVWQENQVLQQQVAGIEQVARQLYAQLQELQPLKVWAGHPCCDCGKPLSGVVNGETAARLMKDLGHKDCLDKQGSGLGKLLLGASVLYGLSRLR